MGQPAQSFALLLRQMRAEARLTQEELAYAAGLSPRSVSDLERGVHLTARKDTAGLLADVLGLVGTVRVLFVAAARGRAAAEEVLAAWKSASPGLFAAAATRALPRDISSFTGRQAELGQLLRRVGTLAAAGGVVGIHSVDGMAGIGKTTFAVHAAHRLAEMFPDGQFFLPLHAHTVGQRPVDPADGLASLLLIAGVAAAQIPPSLEARASRWRDHVAGKKMLLLLDDAAGHEQVRPLLPSSAGSLVLITSRRRLTALEDAAVVSLDTMPPGEAATLLARLADRPELGSGAGPGGELTRLCGYLPLAIGMVARQLRHHPARTAAGLASDLSSASDRLAELRAENLSVAAAFDLSYQDLSPGTQRLFRCLGLVPGSSVDAYGAAALLGLTLADARRQLDELYDHHLITEPESGRYLLHDLLREHARALAAGDDPAQSRAAESRLLDYYAHTATDAGRHIPDWATIQGRRPPGSPPACMPDLSAPGSAAAWLDSERANLQAAADQAAASGQHLHAVAISAATGGFLRNQGHWDQAAILHRTALAAAQSADDRSGRASALDELGLLAWLTGDYPAAAANLGRAAALHRDLDDRQRQAHTLNNLGSVQGLSGDYRAAAESHQQAQALSSDLRDQHGQAASLTTVANAQQTTGSLARALELSRQLRDLLAEANASNVRGTPQALTAEYHAYAASLKRALDLFRDQGARPMQAWALNDLGMVQQLTGDYTAAAASHAHALDIYRDLGARLSEAEVLNSLGQLDSRTGATQEAREHHIQALAIARGLGVPVEEARALEGIGDSYRQDGNPAKAASHLRQALTIYERIGTSGAQRVRKLLADTSRDPN